MSLSLKIDFREEGKILFLKKVQEVRKHAENVRPVCFHVDTLILPEDFLHDFFGVAWKLEALQKL